MGIQNQNFPAHLQRITVNLEDAAIEEEKLFSIIEVKVHANFVVFEEQQEC